MVEHGNPGRRIYSQGTLATSIERAVMDKNLTVILNRPFLNGMISTAAP